VDPAEVESIEQTLEVLGNAGAVPVVIFLTQLIKKRVGDFKYGSDLLALGISFVLCFGWTFYNMSADGYFVWQQMNGLETFRWAIDQLIVGFATWLAASKIYDLGHGNKKRTNKVAALEEEIVKLRNGHFNEGEEADDESSSHDAGEGDGQDKEDSAVSDKLRDILEGKD
jgi:hypothetical protein